MPGPAHLPRDPTSVSEHVLRHVLRELINLVGQPLLPAPPAQTPPTRVPPPVLLLLVRMLTLPTLPVGTPTH